MALVRAAGAAGPSSRNNLLLYPVRLGIQDIFHYFKVIISGLDAEDSITDNVGPVTPIRCELVLNCFHVPVTQL